MGRNGGRSSSSLAPGFRFHPTDEELVAYYLRRKVSGKPFRVDAISEIEVYKAEPWDLPGFSKLKTRDLEWYFFSSLDRKYSNGSKTNRATSEGYWKTTGKDRPVCHRSKVVGMKKTLVFHRGRAPRGERTNWVMHEYRLANEQPENAGVLQESFVLCRIFQKSGSGPKNGERYGAPLVEEEWEQEEIEGATLPGEPVADDEVFITDDLFTDANDLDQNFTVELPFEDLNPPLNFYQGDDSGFVEDLPKNELDSLPLMIDDEIGLELNDDQKFFNLPVQHELEAVKNEYAAPTNVMCDIEANNLPGEQCLDNVNIAPSNEGFYLEANDLSEPVEAKSSDFRLIDDYLAYFDAENDVTQYLSFDSPDSLDANGNVSDQTLIPDQNLVQADQHASTSNQQLPAPDAYEAECASSSKQVLDTPKVEPDSKYQFMKKESQMLGHFPAHPIFGSDYPTKDMAAKLHAVHSSEPVRVTAGIIRISDLFINDSGIHWSMDKRGNVSVVLSFDLPVPEGINGNPASIKELTGMISQKMTSIISSDWLYLLFSVMLLFISAKAFPCVSAR
uniref:NAC domain containing transcription factor NAC2 n=1 Tax=Fagopyrum tataricum TaxID=62330 RepID=A0A385A3S1_FAGTA|nr:NAC domain containing transcription factor NAC2 [Fagopyrum tataricum]